MVLILVQYSNSGLIMGSKASSTKILLEYWNIEIADSLPPFKYGTCLLLRLLLFVSYNFFFIKNHYVWHFVFSSNIFFAWFVNGILQIFLVCFVSFILFYNCWLLNSFCCLLQTWLENGRFWPCKNWAFAFGQIHIEIFIKILPEFTKQVAKGASKYT